MTTNYSKKSPQKRRYPPFYEKIVPIVLGIIAVFIVVLLIIIAGVTLKLFPWQ